MNINFTNHAKRRIVKRNILEQEVIDAIKYPDRTTKKYNKYYFQKNIGRGIIEVVCEIENNIKVITIYWM